MEEVFDWIEENTSWNRREDWSWEIFDNNVVDMLHNSNLPVEYIDQECEKINLREKIKTGIGIKNLLKELKGKKILSVDKRGRWYLKIINNK